LNNKADKSLIVDKNKAPWIIKMFELYATGEYSLKDLRNKMTSLGFN